VAPFVTLARITAAGANFGVEEVLGLALGLGEVKLMTGEMADRDMEAEEGDL
jgi:hypothetical protein